MKRTEPNCPTKKYLICFDKCRLRCCILYYFGFENRFLILEKKKDGGLAFVLINFKLDSHGFLMLRLA